MSRPRVILGEHLVPQARATGITVFLFKGGTVEKAMRIAGHSSPETTRPHDRTQDQIKLDENERIAV